MKRLLIKLGSKCNLNCKHCHCSDMDFKFNNDILPFIKSKNLDRITFSGGEPFKYWRYIKKIMLYVGDSPEYKIVNNGTLLDEKKINFLNQYKSIIILSYDGEDTDRDMSISPKYELFKDLKRTGIATTVYNRNNNLIKLKNDIGLLREKYNIGSNMKDKYSFYPNFTHQTDSNSNLDITIDTAKKFCLQLGDMLEDEMRKYKNTGCIGGILERALTLFKIKDYKNGFACCNDDLQSITIEGNYLLCPYLNINIGNIKDGIDWSIVNSYRPERCNSCSLWSRCRNSCIANITENECYIYRVMYNHYAKLLLKYNIDENLIGGSNETI